MSLTKDYYTAAELAARQGRERVPEAVAARLVATADRETVLPVPRPQRLRTLLDQTPGRLLVGAWASNFVHG